MKRSPVPAPGCPAVRLRYRLALDRVALRGEVLREELARWGLVVGRRVDVDKLLRQLDGVNRHAASGYPTACGSYTDLMSEAVPFRSHVKTIEDLRGPAGRLEALLNTGRENALYAVLVAHPHPLGGGTMHNKVVYHAAKAFSSFGLPVLRFNFRGTRLSEGTL